MLVLTTFDMDEHVYDALGAGASGFLLTDAGSERLTEGVRAVVLAYESGLVSPGAVSGESGSGMPPDTRTAP